jgi:hypothetical protein
MSDDPYAQYADPYAQYAAPKQAAAPQGAPPTFTDYLKSIGSAAVRPVAKAVAGLPLISQHHRECGQ